MKIRAQVIYDNYPHADLLPVPRPRAAESVATYRRRIDKVCAGRYVDMLFLFLLNELEDADCDEGGHRLASAIAAIESVRVAIYEEG